MLAEEVPEAREHMGRFALAMAKQSDGSLVLLATERNLLTLNAHRRKNSGSSLRHPNNPTISGVYLSYLSVVFLLKKRQETGMSLWLSTLCSFLLSSSASLFSSGRLRYCRSL
jgi:hypothetical protein